VEGIILTGDFNTAVKEWAQENKLKYSELSSFLSFSPFFSHSHSLYLCPLSFNSICLNLLNFLVLFFSLYLLV
jgi:hypothetical protein